MYNKLNNIISHKIKIDNFQARLLNENDIPLLQKFYEKHSKFFQITTGKDPNKNEAEMEFKNVPEGKTIEDKFLIGLFDSINLIAFVDLLQNYKQDNQWSIGEYIIDMDYRGNGLANKLLNVLEDVLVSLKVNSLRIIVQEQNICAFSFWKKNNFIEIERIKQEIFPDKDNIILVKKLERKEPSIEEKYFKDGKLTSFPSKPNEQKLIYELMLKWFEKGKKYTEIEINSIIKDKIACRDHVTLRRDLVDNKYLNRSDNGKEYWV